MIITKKSIGIVLVICLLVVFGCRKGKQVEPEIANLIWQLDFEDEVVAKAAHDELVQRGKLVVKPLIGMLKDKDGVYLVIELAPQETKRTLLARLKTSIYASLKSEGIYLRPDDISRKPGTDVLFVNVTVPNDRRTGVKRQEYLQKASNVLTELEFFDEPKLIGDRRPEKVTYSLELNEMGLQKYSERAIDQILEVLRNRIDAFGVAELAIWREPGKPRIIIQLPGAKDSSQSLGVVKTMGRLEFKVVKNKEMDNTPWIGDENTPPPDSIPTDCEVRRGAKGEWYVLKKPALLTGDHIETASVRQEATYRLVVAMSFDSQGARTFAEITGAHVGDRLAILLDDVVQSAPNIREKIHGGSAQIDGDFTVDEANYLAKILRAGAFPAGFKIADERTIGPRLRARIVSVLGEIGDSRALPELESLAKDDTNMDVRNEAQNAIRRIKSK